MRREFKKHFMYYLSLIAIFVLGLVLIVLASSSFKLQGFIVVLTVLFYVCWGILHHLINHELTRKVIVEYILIALLGLSILFFVYMLS